MLPRFAILCIEGYHPKDAGNCHQICVPDHGDECQSDADCTIYCITQPCPSGRCTGGTCRVGNDKRPPKQTSTCKPRCAQGFHCQECKTVEGSDFFCMPDGATC